MVEVTTCACGMGVVVPGEHLAGDQPCEVRHVDHEDRPDVLRDLPHLREVQLARVRGVARDEDQRLHLLRGGRDLVVVEQPGLALHAVRVGVEHLRGHIAPEAVREVATGVQARAEEALVAERLPDLLPRGVIERLGVRLAELRRLDALAEDRPVGDQVGVGPGVRLHVGVLGAEELAGPAARGRLDAVDVLAAGVEAARFDVTGIFDVPLRVLIGEEVRHRELDGERRVVLARDHLEVAALVDHLLDDRARDLGRDGGDDVEEVREG